MLNKHREYSFTAGSFAADWDSRTLTGVLGCHGASKLCFSKICWYCLLLSIVPCVAPPRAGGETRPPSGKAAATRSWTIRRQPDQLVNGAPAVFEVTPPVHLTALSAKWLEHEVLFSYNAAAKAWYGIAGVSLETRPGTYALELKGTTSKSAEITFSQDIAVRAAKYPSIAVTVAKRFTEPSKEQLAHIHQDKVDRKSVV